MTRGWFKSSWSSPSGDCVEVTFDSAPTVRIRDSKNPAAELAVPFPHWSALVGTLGNKNVL